MAKSQTIKNDLFNNCGPTVDNYAGRYRLDVAEIDYGGVSHPITAYTQRIFVFEDIDKSGVTGWIEMIDSDNLVSGHFSTHALVGQEILRLKFRTFGSHLPVDFISHPLHIHKIENLRPKESTGASGSVSAQQYRIHFCSPEVLNNDRIRISQAFEGSYDEIIEKILVDHLKTKKDIWLEKTEGIHKIVIPNMHPFDAINMILKQSRSKKFKQMPNYNFYETTKGYRFKSMYVGGTAGRSGGFGSGGMETWNTDWQLRITYSPTKMDGNYITQMTTAKSYKYTRLGDSYTAIADGMLASKSIRHDSLHKTFSIKAATYLTDADSPLIKQMTGWKEGIVGRPHFTEGKVYVSGGDKYEPQFPFTQSETFTEFPDSRVFFYSTAGKHKDDFLDSNGVAHTNVSPDDQLQINLRQMQLMHDRYFQLQMVTHGFSGLQVGDSFSFDIPLAGPQQTGAITDQRFSGDSYYITKLVHHIELSETDPYYECILDICPMSAGRQELPDNGKLKGKEKQEHAPGDYKGFLERTLDPD